MSAPTQPVPDYVEKDKENPTAGETKEFASDTDSAAVARSNGTGNGNDPDHKLGRLVVDPDEAVVEFGEAYASKLKRTPDGKWICWPQPCVSLYTYHIMLFNSLTLVELMIPRIRLT